MTRLELAIVLSAVDNANRVINQVQEKLEGLAKAGESRTFAGGLMRVAGDVLGWGEAARSAMSFQDEIARVNTILPPTAKGLQDLGKIEEFAISQSQRHAYAAEQIAESVYMGLSSFLSTHQAMAATTVAEQVAIGTHGQPADLMRTLGTLYPNFADKAKPAEVDFQRLGDLMTTLQTQFAFKDRGEITSALQYATASAKQFQLPLNTAFGSIVGFSAAGLHNSEIGPIFAIDLSATPGKVWIHPYQVSKAADRLSNAFGIRCLLTEPQLRLFDMIRDAQGELETAIGAASFGQVNSQDIAADRYGTIGSDATALGPIACEVYEHLGKVDVFRNLNRKAQVAYGDPLFLANQRRLHVLGEGITLWAMRPYEIDQRNRQIKEAAGNVAHASARFFLDHSPIPEGPLRNLNLARTITMPLTSRALPALAIYTASAIAQRLAIAGGGNTVIHYSPTIHVNGSSSASARDEWVKGARQHADELFRIIKDKTYREQRLRFDW